MRQFLLVLAFGISAQCGAQSLGVTIHSSTGDGATADLYKFLNVDRYEAKFSGAKSQKYNVILVMRSVDKDGSQVLDTLLNTVAWNAMIQGHEGFKWQPSKGASFIAQVMDSSHVKFTCKVGTSRGVGTYALRPGQGYSMSAGVSNYKKPVKVPMGKPFPIVVYTQPYPDPPAPDKVVFYRYCFGAEEPPDQWPQVFGVPHLLVLEMTVLP